MISGGIPSLAKWLSCIFALTAMLIASAGEVRVFAAASLTDALKEIAADYQKKTGDKIIFNFGASSFLARQIEEGAPADIFFSADEAWMDHLENKNLIVKETRRSLLSNSLVIVVANDSTLKIESAKDLALPAIKRIALADPTTVPAGKYAKQYLEKINLWTSVAKKVIPTDNVRAALSAVEAGNVEAGIVYRTDARISRKTKIAHEIPRVEGPDIRYPVALLANAPNSAAAKAFLSSLTQSNSIAVFRKVDFIVDN
jgi:molybdate transport system substrate-binding protein